MKQRSGLLATGIVVLIVGVLAAAGLWYSAGQREADAVRNLARAPLGCDTTLDFEGAGEFLVFVETAGPVPELAGSCTADVDFGQLEVRQDLPPVRVVLTSPSGREVGLDARTGVDYDAAESTGQVIRSFEVEDPGDYTLRVESPDGARPAAFQIAVGRDPGDGVQQIRLGAMAAGATGLLIGLLLIVMARRGASPTPGTAATDPWATTNAWPTAPPGTGQPSSPAAWQQPPGPPTMPAAPPSAPSIPGQPPLASSPDPSPWAPNTPRPAPDSGASGDGERSPWAPPGGAEH